VPSDRQPSSLWSVLIQRGITWFVGTPAHYALLLDWGMIQSGVRRATGLRLAMSAGAPLPPDLSAKLAEALGVPLLNLYGMSESLDMAMTAPDQDVQPGAVGRALCEGLRIVDRGGQAVAPGTPGEIVTRGGHVFPGYLDDPTATAAAFLPGGWFRTGDVGYRDDKGVLFLTGRLTEVINRGGEKVAPAEVEAALLAHPAVAEAAVFALSHARLGEEVAAAVVVQPGATVSEHELRRAAARRLAPHKVPRHVWIVEVLPRTATGKVQRGKLSQTFSSAVSRPVSKRVPGR
jgi:acyl-coenzyme A synthetase/AMP-(fatty) acid ligase